MSSAPTLESVIQEEIATLEAVKVVLKDETAALANLDYPAIDRARERKENFDVRLREIMARRPTGAQLPAKLKQRHGDLCRSVSERASHNRIRLEACYAGIRALVAELTGQNSTTYAPRRRIGVPAQPVLASTVE